MTHVDTAGAIATMPSATSGDRVETVSGVLERCRRLDVITDRVVPGRRGALDWLVVSRSAVYLVDEYDAGGARPSVRARQGGVRTDDSWVVVIGGHEQRTALAGLRARAMAVRQVLAEAGWTQGGLVVPVLCVDRGGLPMLRRQLRLGSCLVVGSSGLGRLVGSRGSLGADARARITKVLVDAFPKAPGSAA
jgi:hypothetical protein